MTVTSPYIFPGLVQDFDEKYVELAIEHICENFNVGRDVLFSQNRKQNIVQARFTLMWILRKKLKLKLTDIARMFNQHHTSVLYAVRKVRDHMDVYTDYHTKINHLIKTIPHPREK